MKSFSLFLWFSLLIGVCQAETLPFDTHQGLDAVANPVPETPLIEAIIDEKPPTVLPVAEAFQLTAQVDANHLLNLHWQIAEGCYLYRDKLAFSLKVAGELGIPQLPTGILKEDKLFGEVEVYQREVTVTLPFFVPQSVEIVTLAVSYQGCAENRFCYPPTTQMLTVALPADSDKPKAKPTFLKADQAFIFSAHLVNPTRIKANWQIAPGYYLYRDKFKFSLVEQGVLRTLEFPPSTLKQDLLFGATQVYTEPSLTLELPVEQVDVTQPLTLEVEYQGCAEAGLCYPPVVKTVALGKTMALSEQDRIVQALSEKNLAYTIGAFFVFGLLLAFTPCVFPMIPILSSLVIGQAAGTLRAFIMSATYVLAVAVTYTTVGVIAGLAGKNLQIILQQPWVMVSFSLVFVLLSLSLFGFYELQIPNRWQTKLTQLSNRQQGGNLLGVAIMGMLSALIVGPCVAAPLAGALIYISQTRDAVLGGLALFSMSMGMGIPLLVIGTSAGKWLPKAGTWMEQIKIIFGVMLLGLAIWMLRSVVPGPVTLLLWASLFIVSAIYMKVLEPLAETASGWQKLGKGLGFILLVYGIILIVGASRGQGNLLQPLQTIQQTPIQATTPFKRIKNLAEFDQALAVAKADNKIVMLDFYADWCVSCVELEQFTFADPQVQTLLAKFTLLQADVTANNESDQALYQRFTLFGPPAILFFAPDGQELSAHRIIGFIGADAFHAHLTQVLRNL